MTPSRAVAGTAAMVLALTVAALGAPRGAAPALSPAQKAKLYHRWAEEALAEPSVEARQGAVRDLENAIQLEPGNPEHWLLLGKVRLLGEYDSEARACFRRAVVLDPRSLPAWLELGMSWKREWQRSLDTLALAKAIGELDTATAVSPRATDPWLQLVPLRVERSDLDRAAAAAARALAGRPRRLEAVLATAYVAYRRGEIERSDSLFRAVLPWLDPELRSPYQDPSPWVGGGAEFSGWAALDPDPTTPENEIQLEYWSRVTHAFLLYHDPVRPGLDARARTYIRYGPARRTEVNPFGVPLYFRTFGTNLGAAQGPYAERGGNPGRPPTDFPAHVLAWHYPELGMRIVLQDRSLHGRFEPMATQDFDPSSVPDPRRLSGQDLVAMNGGLAVFPKLPPREQRLEVGGVIARFEGDRGPRLFAQVEAPGVPSDTLTARWVVTDAHGTTLARGTELLALAACDPAERRQVQFSADLPAGAYDVAVSVRDPSHRRGLFRTRASLERGAETLALSDVVLACGHPALNLARASARFDANVDARVIGKRPLVAYIEIYRLTAGEDGLSRFEYGCEVRRLLGRERRGSAPLIATTREESHLGSLRRQFVSVPVQALPPGRYRLEVWVRDLVAGAVAERAVEFVRE